ncbi:MAG: amino acid ABC transporter ATP-binding protein [Chloroflexota bacterium]
MLRIENLHKWFGQRHVLKGIDMAVNQQDRVVIFGPSGSGKSTCLRCINLLEQGDSGSIVFLGTDFGPDRRRGMLPFLNPGPDARSLCTQVGMVFQRFNLFPHLTVLDNVSIGLRKVKRMAAAEARDRAEAQLARVGLETHMEAYPGTLSGGQQQRVAIARALAMDPRLMLFDEPTSALDPELTGEVLSVMRELASQGMTMVVVTHEMAFAREVGNKLFFFDDGRICEQGDAEILRNPKNERTRSFIQAVL